MKIVDGKVGQTPPGQIDLDINGIHTMLDSVNKARPFEYDFRLWTLDGTYSLESNHQKAVFPKDSSMRLLVEYGVFLPQRGDTAHLYANNFSKEKEEELHAWLYRNDNSSGGDNTSVLGSFNLFANRLPTDWGKPVINFLPKDDEDEEELLLDEDTGEN